MNNTQDAIAAFLAKGGKVTKAAEGEGLGLSPRQWYRQTRDIETVKVIDDTEEVEAALAERRFEIGAGFGINGLNDFNDGVRKHGARKMLGWE